MSRKSDAAERGREAYARWKELSEDEKNEDLRRRLLASDQNNPVVRDMLKTVEKDIRGRSSANGGPTLEYESHGLFALTVPHLHGPRPGRRAFGMRGVVLKSLWFPWWCR